MIFWVTMPFRPRRRSLGKGLGEAGIEPGAHPGRGTAGSIREHYASMGPPTTCRWQTHAANPSAARRRKGTTPCVARTPLAPAARCCIADNAPARLARCPLRRPRQRQLGQRGFWGATFRLPLEREEKETMLSLPGDRQRPDPVKLFGAGSVFLPISGTPEHEPSRSHRSKRSRTTDSSDIDELLPASFTVPTRSYAELISSRTVLLPTACFFPLIVPALGCAWLGGRVFG
jgi:hypothetical protein